MACRLLTTLLFGFVTNCNAQLLTDSLVFLYNFNGNTMDNWTNDLHLENYGASLTEDRNGTPNSAYYFDGTDNYMEIPYSDLIQIDPPASFAFWVRTDVFHSDTNRFWCTDATVLDYNGYRMTGAGSNDGKILLTIGSGQGGTAPQNRRTKESDSTITLGNWHHVVGVVRDGLDMDIYIDCENAGGFYHGAGDMLPAHSGSPGRVGSIMTTSWFGEGYFIGAIDQFAMWNRDLGLGEVTKICDDDLEDIGTTVHGVEENSAEKLYTFPNPTSNKLWIQTSLRDPINTLKMFDLHGKKVFHKDFSRQALHSAEIDIEHLPAGYYTTLVETNRNRLNSRFVKQ